MSKFQKCVVCQSIETRTVFNINFSAIPICQACSRTIFLQEATWLSGLPIPQEVKERKITTANKHTLSTEIALELDGIAMVLERHPDLGGSREIERLNAVIARLRT